MDEAGGGGVINLLTAIRGIGKISGKTGEGCVRGHLGTQIIMYPASTTTPTHLMINDSPPKQSFYSFRDEISQPRSFSAVGIAYTLTVSTVKMGVYILWKLRSNCSLGIGMIRDYKATIESAHFCKHYTLVYREQQPAGLQQRRNGGCLLIVRNYLIGQK